VTIELKNGQVYRGTLESSASNMNCRLSDVTLTDIENDEVRELESVYIRGSHIHFMVLPNLLQDHKMFEPLSIRKDKLLAKKNLNPQTLKPMRRKKTDGSRRAKPRDRSSTSRSSMRSSLAPPMPIHIGSRGR